MLFHFGGVTQDTRECSAKRKEHNLCHLGVQPGCSADPVHYVEYMYSSCKQRVNNCWHFCDSGAAAEFAEGRGCWQGREPVLSHLLIELAVVPSCQSKQLMTYSSGLFLRSLT